MAKPKSHKFSDAELASAELSRLLQREGQALESPEEDEPAMSGETSILQVNPVSLEVSADVSENEKRPRSVKRLGRGP